MPYLVLDKYQHSYYIQYNLMYLLEFCSLILLMFYQ
mgnify:CR=1 FL=1